MSMCDQCTMVIQLRAIIARADARIAELEQAVTVRDTEIARLETDLELARRDAGRYQWLRKYHFGSPYIVDFHGCAIRGDDADSDIDAARVGNGVSDE